MEKHARQAPTVMHAFTWKVHKRLKILFVILFLNAPS